MSEYEGGKDISNTLVVFRKRGESDCELLRDR